MFRLLVKLFMVIGCIFAHLKLKSNLVAPTSIDYNAPAVTSANHAVDISTLTLQVSDK